MGQKQDKELGKEDILTGAVSDYEILNQSEEEAHSNSPKETDQNFVRLDTSILEPCPDQEPTRPNDNTTEPSFNQGGKKIRQSYDTDVSQNGRTTNPQLSLAGDPCASEFKTVTSDATATDIFTAVDQQRPDKTDRMTNKTHLKDTPNMLEGSCQVDSADETRTLSDRHNGMTKMSGDAEIKRKFSLEAENADLLERQPFQDKDKHEMQTLSSDKIKRGCDKVCKESAGTVRHKNVLMRTDLSIWTELILYVQRLWLHVHHSLGSTRIQVAHGFRVPISRIVYRETKISVEVCQEEVFYKNPTMPHRHQKQQTSETTKETQLSVHHFWEKKRPNGVKLKVRTTSYILSLMNLVY